jgi:type I restriction enzyme S subunit
MSELPKGWEEASLGDLAVNRDSSRIPVNAKERAHRSGAIPYYGAAGQVGWIDRPIFDEPLLLVGEDGVQFFDADKRKAYMVVGPSWVNNHAHVLTERRDIDLRYLMHYLNQFDYHGYANGTTRLKLTRLAMDSIPVPVAPTDEQKRIVTAIEEAFSKLDAGEAGLRTVRQLLKRMRDAILAAAVTGRLVPQDPTDTPATKLLADLGVASWRGGDLPDGWAGVRLGDVARVGSGTTPNRGRSDYWMGGTVPWVTSGQVTAGLIREAREFVTDVALAETSLRMWPTGTLLVAMYGEGQTRGRCAELAIDATCNQACAAIDLHRNIREYGKFIRLFFDANYAANRKLASGGVQPNLNAGLIKDMPIPLPPLEEQARIVTEVDRQLSDLDACERAVDAGLSQAAALRRSVLKAAFEGRLVPQDPADEPASVLLDRIRAERAASPATGKRRGGRST